MFILKQKRKLRTRIGSTLFVTIKHATSRQYIWSQFLLSNAQNYKIILQVEVELNHQISGLGKSYIIYIIHIYRFKVVYFFVEN